MEKITVPFITGDGVGAEVTPSMQAVVDAALKKAYGDSRSIGWKEVLAGERHLMKRVPGCRKKRWKHSALIK